MNMKLYITCVCVDPQHFFPDKRIKFNFDWDIINWIKINVPIWHAAKIDYAGYLDKRIWDTFG